MQEAELPAHRALLPWLEQRPDYDAEFEADLADLFTLIKRSWKEIRADWQAHERKLAQDLRNG
jgi:hypothetical protein